MAFPRGWYCPSASCLFWHVKLSRSAQDCAAAVVTTASGRQDQPIWHMLCDYKKNKATLESS